MNCSNNPITLLKALFATAIFLISVNSCTEVDDRLGSNLLPQNQKMKIRVSTVENAVKTYLFKEDSLISSRLGYGYLGNVSNSTFGARKNSFVIQLVPSSYPTSYSTGTEYESYGIKPIVDSIYIHMPLYAAFGDTTRVQKFEVYAIDGPELLSRDSVYYTKFPIDRYISDKLFTFTHTGLKSVASKLIPTQAGKDFLNSLVNLDMDIYKNDSLFLEIYKGLYITPTDDSPVDAAVYTTAFSNAGLLMYSRMRDSLDVSAIYDTLRSTFSFADLDATDETTRELLVWNNVSINIVDFDYAGSTLGTLENATNGFTDTLETSTTQPVMYVQPMGGVTGYLRFTDEFIAELRDLKNEPDEDGNNIEHSMMINQALMYIWLEDASTASMDASMERMGSYTNLRKVAAISDYQYSYEYYRRVDNGEDTYVLPYNGFLNRSNGYYEFDITSYIQQLAKEEDKENPDPDYRAINPIIHLAPEAFTFYGTRQSAVMGYDSSQPIKIRLTYALIEPEQ